MQFSKILTTAFLAVAATAAPAPQTYSVDFGAIQAFTSSLQTICSQIQGNLANSAGEFSYVISGYQGDASVRDT
jgi:type IV secretory pathway VirB2 component (pilin)